MMAWSPQPDKRVVRIGVYENPPKIYTNSNGTVAGFWPEIINAIAEKENWQIVWVPGTWDESLARLAANEIDIMPDTGWTEARSEKYTFSNETVLVSWARLYVPQGSTIETILDLEGKTVAGLSGSVNFDGPEGIKVLAQKFDVHPSFIGFSSYQEVFDALQNRTVDAGVTNKDFGDLNESKYNVSRTPIIIAPTSIRFAFTQDAAMTPYLVNTIDADLKELKADSNSIYYKALDKYLGENSQTSLVKVIPTWVNIVILNGAAAICFLIIVILLARKQIRERTESLRNSEARNRVLVENNPDQIFKLSKEGVFLDFHSASTASLYAPPENFLGKNVKEVLPENLAELTLQKIAAAMETQALQTYEYTLTINDKPGDFEARMTANGADEIIVISRDISERKRAERELRESEERYQMLNRVVPVGIFRTDKEGSTTYVNPSWCQIAGLSSKEALGNGWLKAVHPDDIKTVRNNWQAATRGDHASLADYRFVHGDGSVTWVMGQAVPERDSTGQIVGFVGTITDITERRKVQELKEAVIKAESADKLKSAFLATMSHELRTPLNSIIGFTGILLQKLVGPLSGEQDKQLRMIQGSARHLLELINDVLDISKIEAGQMTLALEPFDLKTSIESSLDKIRPLAEKKGIKLSTKISVDSLQLTSDRRRVEQVLLNLLNNAVKFTEKGEVHLECKVEGDEIVTSIIDSGIGIKPEDISSLFRPFSQVDIGITRQYEGTGLGLSICKRIVELLGGQITVKSEWEKGSEFSFSLPIQGGKV